MAHSVSRHLDLSVADYDRSIRRFIPGYEAMVDAVVGAILEATPRLVLDLGGGTGALSARLLERDDRVTVELWDVDPSMLEAARTRLARSGDRARFRIRSFDEPYPAAGGIMASLSLHHVRTLDAKRGIYARIAAALEPGGVFANGDVTMPTDPAERDAMHERWADHLVAHGLERDQAHRHFAAWSELDTYFPLADELAGVAAAGLVAGSRWQDPPMAVVVGRKPAART